MYELSIKTDFAAAHSLRGHEGKCKILHGHTWKVEVVVTKSSLDRIGRIVDFSVVKKQLKDFLSTIDHRHLNICPPFDRMNPTTENLARYIFDGFSKVCRPLKLKRVTVWESDTASVTYSR